MEFVATAQKQSDLPKAFVATAQNVRDSLIINWNATYELYEKTNLELSGVYAEALQKLGHNLEDVANQEPDAALGNGGLGRLASCFLDSLATLNYPAWGYGLRYRCGLFKQLNTENGQEEVAENWLEVRFCTCFEDIWRVSPWALSRGIKDQCLKGAIDVCSKSYVKDVWHWPSSSTRIYSVEHEGNMHSDLLWKLVWKTAVLEKINCFIWMLANRGVLCNSNCVPAIWLFLVPFRDVAKTKASYTYFTIVP
ncbi:alpha-1,4 glucan phosphorylase L-1 isozyme, chloroplastic/amyloplastic-like [Euphorbia lathyris]|uniref:alpha-1,4 glucan phosphorylase L-1 isozyme, chloroplastic/amyloplastic-like n=1 Tax=Euphorbia lathyris TaxID=212925 RepID=UPI0033134F60